MKNNRLAKLVLVAGVIALPLLAQAQSNVSDITSAATTTFQAVAALCVTIGTFMVGYRLARKVR